MKLLLNDKEIAHFLNSNSNLYERTKEKVLLYEPELRLIYAEFYEKMNSEKVNGQKAKDFFDDRQKKKFYDKLYKAIHRDVKEWMNNIKEFFPRKREYNFHKIHKNIEYFIEKFGEENIFEMYRNSPYKNFVKGTGLTLQPDADFIRRKDFTDYTQDCLIRNTVGNEELLVTKIDKGYPMWFIDSGYTNFLEFNKKWHRLVRNHLHTGKFFKAPVSRLDSFKKFPVPWRKGGDVIYVIEPGPFAANVFHIDLKTWKYKVEEELRKYTNKPIKFREKKPLRERTKLFDELLFNDDYYCVVSLNSNAATEAIWAGIPAITLGQHITNPVTKNSLSDINNLYYGDITEWLCMLSYSQFTKEELMDGTAVHLVRKYMNV
jgi:hypothetical protein